MNNKEIGWKREKLKQMRANLESSQLNALRDLLPDDMILEICEDCQYYFRTRLMTPIVTIFHMLGAGISREGSFQSAWHISGHSGQSGSLAKARGRVPLVVWQKLDQWVRSEIDKESKGKEMWRGHRVIGVDGTCISMSEEPELVEHFGRCNTRHGRSGFPVARVLTMFHLKTLMTVGHHTGAYKSSEGTLLTKGLQDLRRGDVMVFDRHFSGANLYVRYGKMGIEFITRAHQCLRMERLTVVETLGKGDQVVEMPVHPEHRREDPTLPASIRVRLIKTTAKIREKKECFWLATSLLDANRYPASEIRAWYKRRWKVETLIEELKVWLGADVLRSKSVEGIYKELHARIIALNLVHWLILRAAKKHKQTPDRISVSATLRLASGYSLKMSTAPCWQLPILYAQLLEKVAHSKVPFRPDRIEPRMIRREKKSYSKLKIPRCEWRRIYAMAA